MKQNLNYNTYAVSYIVTEHTIIHKSTVAANARDNFYMK